jgi:hypothetical protein
MPVGGRMDEAMVMCEEPCLQNRSKVPLSPAAASVKGGDAWRNAPLEQA